MAPPLDEEPLDRWINRPLARPLTKLLMPLPVTADQVTFAAALSGVAAGAAMTFTKPGARVAAFGLAWLAMVLDCADGQLARARGGGSRYGYFWDGLSDYVIATALHLGFMVVALRSPAFASIHPAFTVAMVVVCGVMMAMHSNAFEMLKFRYRAALGESPGAQTKKQAEILASLNEEKGVRAALARFALGTYHRWQVSLLQATSDRGAGTRGAFLWSTLLGPTLRTTVLISSILLSARWPAALWIYPVFAVPVAGLVYAVLRLRR